MQTETYSLRGEAQYEIQFLRKVTEDSVLHSRLLDHPNTKRNR